MKIDYDPSLYRQIANFPVNEIVRVANRKGRNRTIHITNIVKLSWLELQLLVPEGADRFSKMVILFNKLSGTESLTSNGIKGESLSAAESCEVDEYIRIFKREGFSKHTEVNDFISKNELWNNFKTIRSLNDHGKFKEIEGIQPKYFEVICHILNISDEGGLPLDSYTKY